MGVKMSKRYLRAVFNSRVPVTEEASRNVGKLEERFTEAGYGYKRHVHITNGFPHGFLLVGGLDKDIQKDFYEIMEELDLRSYYSAPDFYM